MREPNIGKRDFLSFLGNFYPHLAMYRQLSPQDSAFSTKHILPVFPRRVPTEYLAVLEMLENRTLQLTDIACRHRAISSR
jgi:hypothetical protein